MPRTTPPSWNNLANLYSHYTYAAAAAWECARNMEIRYHTLICDGDFPYSERYLACIPMKNLRILKSEVREVTKTFLTTVPPVQLKELHLIHSHDELYSLASLLWNYLASVTSLRHLSLSNLLQPDHDGPLSHFTLSGITISRMSMSL